MIKAAPWSFAVAVILAALICWLLIRWMYGERMDALKERIEHYKHQLENKPAPSVNIPTVSDSLSSDAFKSPKWEIVTHRKFQNEEIASAITQNRPVIIT